MKLFVVALICLALVCGFCVYGTMSSLNIIDELLGELHHIPTDLGEVPPAAKEVSENLIALWEKDYFIISMFHPHQHLDQVKENMVSLKSYAFTEEYSEWREAHDTLEESLLHLRGLLTANIDNIL